jgi:hypothetical protein
MGIACCVYFLPAAIGLRVYSASNRNEYQKQRNIGSRALLAFYPMGMGGSFPGGKAAGA